MWYQFILENAHFAVNALGALILFAVFWLYADAWSARRSDTRTGLRAIGFLLLSASFLAHGVEVESTVMSQLALSGWIATIGVPLLRAVGYSLILWSIATEPLMPTPKTEGLPGQGLSAMIAGSIPAWWAILWYPIAAAAVGLLYLRRAGTGLERHLRAPGIAFLLFALSDFVGLSILFRGSTNVDVFNLVAPFGPLWILSHLILIAGLVVMERWVFGYLLKRFETQLFIIFTTTVVVIYLVITVVFTGLLVGNVASITLSQLETDAKVLSYAIDGKKQEALADSKIIASDPQVIDALTKGERRAVADLLARQLTSKNQSYAIVVNATAQVVARGEDAQKYGDSLSGDAAVTKALSKEDVSGIIVSEGVLSPELSVRAATPIVSNGTVLGAVLVGTQLDTAFVDGLKHSTGLEASLYGGTQLSSTTLVTGDGVTRPSGITMTNQQVKTKVIDESASYVGDVTMMNKPYYAAFLPVSDVSGTTVGMLSVARSQIAVLALAGKSIQTTFAVAAALIALSIIPAYAIARFLARQL